MSDENNEPSVEDEQDVVQEDEMSPEAGDNNDSRSRPGALATFIALVALLLAAGSGAGVYWLWLQGSQQQITLRNQYTETQNNLADVQAKIDARLQQLASAQEKVGQAQRSLESSFASLHEELGRDRNAWAIAETVYFLQLANARLQLLQDVDTALEALTIADKRLQALGDPGFIPVRDRIKKEITELEAVARTDLTGTALSLGALVAQVPKLPLHAPAKRAQAQVEQASSESSAAQPEWREELNRIWGVMRELVEVRRTDKRIEPLLKPEEQHLLVQNIQLQLQTARIAVLQRDSRLYKDSLSTAAEWISNAYDLDADITRSTLKQIKMLESLELSPQLPDISASLRLLRSMSDRQTGTDQ